MVLRIGPCLGMALLFGIAVWGGMSSPIGASLNHCCKCTKSPTNRNRDMDI